MRHRELVVDRPYGHLSTPGLSLTNQRGSREWNAHREEVDFQRRKPSDRGRHEPNPAIASVARASSILVRSPEPFVALS
jgi:hypothetical protein